jgi:hypothetical protein
MIIIMDGVLRKRVTPSLVDETIPAYETHSCNSKAKPYEL